MKLHPLEIGQVVEGSLPGRIPCSLSAQAAEFCRWCTQGENLVNFQSLQKYFCRLEDVRAIVQPHFQLLLYTAAIRKARGNSSTWELWRIPAPITWSQSSRVQSEQHHSQCYDGQPTTSICRNYESCLPSLLIPGSTLYFRGSYVDTLSMCPNLI